MLIHTMLATALVDDPIAVAARLHRSGYLSDAEFTALKARLTVTVTVTKQAPETTVTKQAPETTPSTAIAPQLQPSAHAMTPSEAPTLGAGTRAAMISAAHDGAPLPARFAYHQKVEQHINFSHYTAQRLSGSNRTAKVVLDATMAWLLSTRDGFCAKTKWGEGDCRSSLKGSVELSPAESQYEHDAAIACLRVMCASCQRCNYISVSAKYRDCSWYFSCDVRNLNRASKHVVTGAMWPRTAPETALVSSTAIVPQSLCIDGLPSIKPLRPQRADMWAQWSDNGLSNSIASTDKTKSHESAVLARVRTLLNSSDPLFRNQFPSKCHGRFTALHDDAYDAGLGFTAKLLVYVLILSSAANRILVEVGSSSPWCTRDPGTLQCYYLPWTNCSLRHATSVHNTSLAEFYRSGIWHGMAARSQIEHKSLQPEAFKLLFRPRAHVVDLVEKVVAQCGGTNFWTVHYRDSPEKRKERGRLPSFDKYISKLPSSARRVLWQTSNPLGFRQMMVDGVLAQQYRAQVLPHKLLTP